MKRITSYICTLAALAALAGCGEKTTGADAASGPVTGSLAIEASASPVVATRAEIDAPSVCDPLTVPEAAELQLTLSGDDIAEIERDADGRVIELAHFDYRESWERLDRYTRPDLYPGIYRAELTYGDPGAVGNNLPCYYGAGVAEVRIGETTRCSVEVKIVNAIVRVQLSDPFRSYFSDPQFRLVVDGEPTGFVLTGAAGEQPVFVPADAQVSFEGSVRRPSQTSADDRDGELLEVSVPARLMAAGTLHTYIFTAEAGGLSVGVLFHDAEEGDTDGHDPEMNDDAKLPED